MNKWQVDSKELNDALAARMVLLEKQGYLMLQGNST
jgi:hypothetical protein